MTGLSREGARLVINNAISKALTVAVRRGLVGSDVSSDDLGPG